MANHFADYLEYCCSCKYSPLKDTEEPCNECLTHPLVKDTKKPYNYEYESKKGKNLRGEPKEERNDGRI